MEADRPVLIERRSYAIPAALEAESRSRGPLPIPHTPGRKGVACPT